MSPSSSGSHEDRGHGASPQRPMPVAAGNDGPAANLRKIFKNIEAFEAGASVEKTGTGARREGGQFEQLVTQMWACVVYVALKGGAEAVAVSKRGRKQYTTLIVQDRELIIPASPDPTLKESEGRAFLEVDFDVSGLVASYPGAAEAARRYAPGKGPYAAENYAKLYAGLQTRFDDTIVMIKDGVLAEKILLEYKTAKSSKQRQIDGNAHERLSFQIMQYLEVATRYPSCSFAVLANGAFVRYRNKYHVNFHIQADRLKCFTWFNMEHACTAAEYERLIGGILDWLFSGKPRRGHGE